MLDHAESPSELPSTLPPEPELVGPSLSMGDLGPEAYAQWLKRCGGSARPAPGVGQWPEILQTTPQACLAMALSTDTLFPPPVERAFKVHLRRWPPSGQSSLGVSILSVRGVVGSKNEDAVTQRLDSGASICLMAEESSKKLKHPPRICTGMKVTITQLTNDTPSIKGYVEKYPSGCTRRTGLD